MNALRLIRDEMTKIGYAAIEKDYVFSDVFTPHGQDRTVPIVAFTNTPPSYRNAALAVVEAQGRTATELTTSYRALGAPLLFAVEADAVVVWRVTVDGSPSELARTPLDQLHALFSQNAVLWGPESLQRAKSIGQFSGPRQLDFVDLRLLSAVEGEVHAKLDVLLNESLAEAVGFRGGRARHQIDQRLLFRTIFRLLAAKVLQDRGHQLSATWNPSDIGSVLTAISKYYTLEALPGEQTALQNTIFESCWDRLRNGINFRNISSDDLAFVYENTLITRETRKSFGTHGTPRTVAEYVVGKLALESHDPQSLSIYEPFAGAGIFMVAALRQLREQLPRDWSDAQCHKHLVRHISGDEKDPFAKEVAVLSLILADYPNANGWHIAQVDLFKDYVLQERVKAGGIILCNPPFEDFDAEERKAYPKAAARSMSKPIVALEAAMDAAPKGLGFVLPEPFIQGTQYMAQRRRLEKLYKNIEVVALPDRTFKHSVIRSSAVIARDLRAPTETGTSLRSTVVTVAGRERFLRSGEVSSSRGIVRTLNDTDAGKLWLSDLENVWRYLKPNPTLETLATAHLGIQWKQDQASAIRSTPQKGFVPGIHAANAVKAFYLDDPKYLDFRPSMIRRAGTHPWDQPKVIANAARLSRGPWCFAAAVDSQGLAVSQQLYGVWPKKGVSLNVLCAILNGPVANAYVAIHSPPDRIRLDAVHGIPIPAQIPPELEELGKRYARAVLQGSGLFSPRAAEKAESLLDQMDALVLRAYDLPPRLEKELLEYFREARRPTSHDWTHWFPKDFAPAIPLYRYHSEEYKIATSNWVLDVFKPLPKDQADAVREFLE